MARGTVALAAGALFSTSLGYGLVVPILPHLGGGVGAGGAAFVLSGFAGAKLAVQVPAGVQVDRWGPARVLRFGLVGYALSLLALLGPSTAWIVGGRVVEGAATGLVYVAGLALVARGDPADAGKRIGAVGAIGTSGMLVGPLAGAALLPYGVAAPIVVGAAVGLVAAVASLAAPDIRGAASARGTGLPELLALGRDPGFVGRLVPVGFNKIAFTSFQGIVPLMAPAALGLDQRGIAGIFVALGVGFGLLQAVGGWLGDRYPARPLQLALAPVLVASIAGMAWPATFWVGFAGWVVASALAFAVALRDVVHSCPDPAFHGRVLGGYQTWTDIGTLIGPAVFLPLYSRVGPLVFVALACTLVPLMGVYASLAGRPVRAWAGASVSTPAATTK